MSESDQPGVASPSRQPKRLRIAGVTVLVLGLISAATLYWMGTYFAGRSEDDLLLGNARAESHQMELLYGKMGQLTIDLSDDLKRPGTQALLIAVVSILGAAGCFYFARLMDDDSGEA